MSNKGETTKRILGKRVAPTEPKVLVVGGTGSDAQKIAQREHRIMGVFEAKIQAGDTELIKRKWRVVLDDYGVALG